jgi:MoaA/NifB/PqqE/SkfB family radical SAM enzyme
MTVRHVPHSEATVANEHTQLVLDGTKVHWHADRIEAWERGERFAPITIDMALTRACNYGCVFCYAMLQENERHPITVEVMERFLTECAELDVRAISLVSDGESTLSPAFSYTLKRGHELGISMACGTNGFLLTREKVEDLLPCMDYLRINFDAGEPDAYSEIMGVKPEWFHQVTRNIRDMVEIKRRNNLDVTIGMQMVLMPQYGDQILPLAQLAVELEPDYLVIKHCSDDEKGSLGVDYSKYRDLYPLLCEAEAMSNDRTQIVVKWSKIESEGKRSYARCYGAPFILQVSGSGLVAPCGMLFNERYRKFHIGNIVQDSFKDMILGDRYWEVMNYLASPKFNARRMCGTLCLQHKTNEFLDQYKKGLRVLNQPAGEPPLHKNFI